MPHRENDDEPAHARAWLGITQIAQFLSSMPFCLLSHPTICVSPSQGKGAACNGSVTVTEPRGNVLHGRFSGCRQGDLAPDGHSGSTNIAVTGGCQLFPVKTEEIVDRAMDGDYFLQTSLVSKPRHRLFPSSKWQAQLRVSCWRAKVREVYILGVRAVRLLGQSWPKREGSRHWLKVRFHKKSVSKLAV